MKKSLVALAVMAVSGIASAQSSVTLYGIADAWVGSQKVPVYAGGNGLRQTKIDGGAISGNRFGFMGSEDLGGGLKANFLFEQGFNIDNGSQLVAGQMFGRQSYVGFSGGFGEVRVGKMWTAYDDINGAANSAFDSAFSPNNYVWASTGYNANPGNSLYYASPDLGGFSGAFSYSLGENKTATVKAGNVSSAHIKYAGGPLYVGLGYQTEKTTGNATRAKFTRLNATYDLGVAKLLAGYGRFASGNERTTDWSIGADFPVSSALTVSGGFARSKDNAAAGNQRRTGVGLAAMYALSKRTSLYAGVQTSKQTNSNSKGSLYAVGVRHAF